MIAPNTTFGATFAEAQFQSASNDSFGANDTAVVESEGNNFISKPVPTVPGAQAPKIIYMAPVSNAVVNDIDGPGTLISLKAASGDNDILILMQQVFYILHLIMLGLVEAFKLLAMKRLIILQLTTVLFLLILKAVEFMPMVLFG
ncbi:hypothetical protein [endosymbiont 'TC1' of Trimyema compressum]|uniref:hypothetical protein n=1 Tax=endosymbiont 'TC1' of Trimyema compressum TaxID=243899 RepID=UPI0013923350|nr:hypothetical protein [endosymbiont 'TC1' of Trimyema compressum]